MVNVRLLVKITLLGFSLFILFIGVVSSFGTECYNGYMISLSFFAVAYDVFLELV